MRRLLPLLALILLAAPALATVDLIGPATGTVTGNATLTFEYYVSLPGLLQCAVVADQQQFTDIDVQNNAINSLQVQNVAPGTHAWNVSCAGDTAETSVTRTFRVDTQAPTLAIVGPQENSASTQIALDFIPADDQDAQLSCTVTWQGQEIDSANVTTATHYAKTYAATPGTGALAVACADDAGNTVTATRTVTVDPVLQLGLSTDKTEYGIGESVSLTVTTLDNANVTVDICPNQQGFVQCATAILNAHYPQTITLPRMNKTGEYVVDGIVRYANKTAINRTTYRILNTIGLSVPDITVRPNETATFTAAVSGGAQPYSLLWRLPNGTTRQNVSSVDIRENAPGVYNLSVTATDSAGNARSVNTTLTVERLYDVVVLAVDDTSNAPIPNAAIDFGDEEGMTGADGRAFFTVSDGRNQLFVSAAGYAFYLQEVLVNASQTVQARLARKAGAMIVTLNAPADGSTVRSPVSISFTASASGTCTLLLSTDGAWYAENGTLAVQGATAQAFTRDYLPGTYQSRVECKDPQGEKGVSQSVTFTVADPATQAVAPMTGDAYLQDAAQQLDTLLAEIEGYPQDARQASAALEFDKRVRNAKRAVQQAIRDIDSLSFRDDLDQAAKAAEHDRIVEGVRDLVAKTPVRLDVVDTKSYVRYVDEEDMPDVAAELAGLDGMPDDAKRLAKLLLPEQQKFTISSKLWQVKYTYQDREETVTLVTRTFTYAKDLAEGYSIVEIIPKQVAESAKELDLLTEGDVLRDDPVLRFPAGSTLSYVIPRKIDFERVATTQTLLARQYADGGDAITGFAFLGEGVSVGGFPILWIVALALLAWLAYYFDLLAQVRYLVYKLGRNEQVHYLRVLINESEDHLDANNYEKAEMLYKEIRLTYDTLAEMARNDLYEDVMGLVHKMDVYYFNLLMIEIDKHLRAGDMASAIDTYEKLSGTFGRLDEGRQRQLIEVVTAMAHRLGVAA